MSNEKKDVIYVDAEYRDHIIKFPLSKRDDELFDEEKNVPARVIRIKRVVSPTKAERWKIFANEQVVFIIEGQKISKKERLFLRSLEGTRFLISEFKVGFKSLHELRKRLKAVI